MTTTLLEEELADREIVSSRVIAAPRELLFQAYSDPTVFTRWWGPNGFTSDFEKFDFVPGGEWRFVFHGPDGREYPNEVIFLEIEPAQRIVLDHVSAPRFLATHTLEDAGDGKTRLTWRMVFETAEVCESVRQVVTPCNEQNFDRLEEQLARMAPANLDPGFVISREFDAPRELVWKAWTEVERLNAWWGPAGFEMLHSKLDLWPGGMFHYGMRAPNGFEMWGRFLYREIVPQERLALVVSFSDPQGGITQHPMSATWPKEVLNTTILAEHHGKTTLTLHGIPVNATEAERRTFAAGHDSMRQGFKGTLDQLEAYLAKEQAR